MLKLSVIIHVNVVRGIFIKIVTNTEFETNLVSIYFKFLMTYSCFESRIVVLGILLIVISPSGFGGIKE